MKKLFQIDKKELLGMLLISLAFFFVIAFRKDEEPISWVESLFILVYLSAALLINFRLVPNYFYRQKYLLFILYFLLVLGVVIGIEEFVLEQIFYPISRGSHFDLLFTIFEIGPILIIYVFFKFAWDAAQKESKIQNLKYHLKESQQQFLSYQIGPHFLFNNLNNLYSFALDKSPQTPEFILKLSDLLRYMLYECKEEWIEIEKEMEMLKRFIDLNKIQLGNRANVNFTHSLANPHAGIPPLILIVFVENAFKHSSSSLEKDIDINIHIGQTNSKVVFSCVNNYGNTSNTQDLETGIGLSNVQQRLNLIYTDKYALDIYDEDNKFEVALKMEVKE